MDTAETLAQSFPSWTWAIYHTRSRSKPNCRPR